MITGKEFHSRFLLFFMLANFIMAQSVFAGDVNEQSAKARTVFERQKEALSAQAPESAGENALGLHVKAPVEGDVKFTIHTISLTGLDKFTKSPSLLALLAGYKGNAVTETELQLLVEKMNKKLAEAGYITTRAAILPQNIKAGNLSVTIIPGRIRAFLCAENTSPLHWQNAFPASIGDILNIRDLEQGLENLRRPYGQDVKMKILPVGDTGECDVVLYGIRGKPWGMTLTMGNSGNEASGKYRGQARFIWGNPLGINDSLTLTLGRNNYHPGIYKEYGQDSIVYSVPCKKHSILWRYYRAHTGQPLATGLGTWPYRSKTRGQEVTVQRMLHRDGRSRTQGFFTLGTYRKRNYIGSTELRIQRIKKTNAVVGVGYDRYFPGGQMNARLALSKGLSWLGAQDDALYGNVFSTKGWLWNLDVSFLKAISPGREKVRYQALFHGQQSSRPLCSADEISIGGLYTVRGFTGDHMLSGKSGWYLQQELQWQRKNVQPYIGFDMGKVYGGSARDTALYGLALGIRGGGKIFFDVSAGFPLVCPGGWKKNRSVIYTETGIRF